MGYTHYWYREDTIKKDKYKAIINDFNKVLPKLREHIDLANGLGEGEPIINYDSVLFNGREKCGHQSHELNIAWPSKGAGGIAVPYVEDAKDVEAGSWFGGATLSKRMCGGDCSHETFAFERLMCLMKWDKAVEKEGPTKGLYFAFCKTAFKPYDLAVISFLIIAKHHLVEKIDVHSDGEDGSWWDGKMLCQVDLGYGIDDVVVEGRLIGRS